MKTLDEVLDGAELLKVGQPRDTGIEGELAGAGFQAALDNLKQKKAERVRLAKIAEHGYLYFDEAKITRFLERKVAEYREACKRHDKKKPANNEMDSIEPNGLFRAYMQMPSMRSMYAVDPVHYLEDEPKQTQRKGIITINKDTCCRQLSEGTGRFVWTETPIETYKGIPPTDVLEKARLAIGHTCFDYMTVAEVNEVKDPLLLGRLKGDSRRWFIAQWGEDVKLDDVI